MTLINRLATQRQNWPPMALMAQLDARAATLTQAQ